MLRNSEATLRLVDDLLHELEDQEGAELEAERVSQIVWQLQTKLPGLSALPQLLMQAYGEIMSVIDSLQQARGVLERAAVEKLHHTHEKLREVSSATENAAVGMLDGLDRALVLIDRLDSEEVAGQSQDGAAIRDELRDELHVLIGLLQFQDITSQQLSYASTVLHDLEERMRGTVKLFDPAVFGEHVAEAARAPATPAGPSSFDPAASTDGAEGRQAVADEIFTGR
jgi:hypothetical protein